MPREDVAALGRNIALLLMDVDGVLTNGKLLYMPQAGGGVVETKAFDAADGAAIGFLRRAGIKTGIISGRNSPAVTRRAEELHMDFVYQGLGRHKLPAFAEILERSGLEASRVCYVGDDLQDLPILARAGFPIAVRNARPEVLARATYVTQTPGGEGAIREVAELILKAQGKWESTLAEFLL